MLFFTWHLLVFSYFSSLPQLSSSLCHPFFSFVFVIQLHPPFFSFFFRRLFFFPSHKYFVLFIFSNSDPSLLSSISFIFFIIVAVFIGITVSSSRRIWANSSTGPLKQNLKETVIGPNSRKIDEIRKGIHSPQFFDSFCPTSVRRNWIFENKRRKKANADIYRVWQRWRRGRGRKAPDRSIAGVVFASKIELKTMSHVQISHGLSTVRVFPEEIPPVRNGEEGAR